MIIFPANVFSIPLRYELPYSDFVVKAVFHCTVMTRRLEPIESPPATIGGINATEMPINVTSHFQSPSLLRCHTSLAGLSPQMHFVSVRSSRTHEQIAKLQTEQPFAVHKRDLSGELRAFEDLAERFSEIFQLIRVVFAGMIVQPYHHMMISIRICLRQVT
jgi:hypothetical protein